MEWLQKLNDAIEYIENHLDDEISYEQAAQLAGCSVYYFQRMFTYVAGISLADYIRRRRMSQAAFLLQRTNAKVLDVALTFGYTSPTAFHRAFQAVHKITPTAAKKMGSELSAYPPLRFSVEVSGGAPMTYHIVQKEAMRIVGIRMPLEHSMEKNHKNVPVFWQETMQSKRLSRICVQQRCASILGVSVQKMHEMYYYIAIHSTQKVPYGMYAYEISAATWVIFRNEGQYKASVQGVFQRFYKEWLLFSGYEYAGLPDIEVYPLCEDMSDQGASEVWIAIRKVRNE